MASYKFSDDFLWGTATSGHQIEGGNTNSDWWRWETRDRSKDKKSPFINRSEWPVDASGMATNSYKMYEQDFDLAQRLNNNAIRIGIEWARLEPIKGKFNTKEFAHYKSVLEAAKARGLKTFVTLHHFSSPQWLADMGGWTNSRTPNLFARYAKKCAEEFGDLIDVYITINEPQVYSMLTYLHGKWPPQKTNPFLVVACQMTMRTAHNKAYEAIKGVGDYKVGIVKNIMHNRADPQSKNPLDKIAAGILNFLNCEFFLDRVRSHLDVMGVNFYFTNNIRNLKVQNVNDKVSDYGWWLETTGIKHILLRLKKYNLPIYITENGLADEKDTNRAWYLKEILWSCSEAIQAGALLKGYFHWSLLDNFELHAGFSKRFGLVAVDYNNGFKRTPRPSYFEYAKICKNGTIEK